MNYRKRTLISTGVAAIIIATLSLVIMRTISLPPGTVATEPISEHRSSGGQQTHRPTTRGTTVDKTEPPQNVEVASVDKRALPSESKPHSAHLAPHAPKEQQIDDSITTPQYLYRALQSPNDPYATQPAYNWQHTKTNTTNAWANTEGNHAVIAVIDTGFALQHEDLASQWYLNPGETGQTSADSLCWSGSPQDKSTNGCDDDGNGYVDDWRGWNFHGRYQPTSDPCASNGLGAYVSNNNPQAGASGDDIMYEEYLTCYGSDVGDPFESIAHGTSVAGLAGAASNNGQGIATANWQAKIMPLQVLGDDGMGWTSDIVAAVKYAADNGADIISMSLGGDEHDPALENAIRYAHSLGVPVIAAAGNCGTGTEYGCDPNQPGKMSYPAVYPQVIAVGASTERDMRADFSSYGFNLDLVAPGAGSLVSPTIYRPVDQSTSKPSVDPQALNYTNRYASPLYGTSFAAPIVANIASLIKAHKPDVSADDLTALINGSARKVASMNGSPFSNQYGHGIIDAGSLVAINNNLIRTTSTPTLAQSGNSRSEHTVDVREQMSSGCTAAADSYCIVQLKDLQTDITRYLPAKPTDPTGIVGWHWPGAITTPGVWEVRAYSGSLSANSYLLIHK